MKRLYSILVVVLSFAITMSCSSDDEDTNSIVEITFLEKYQETIWHIAINEFNSEYVKFHNNVSVPFEQWLLIYGQSCYENYSYNVSEFDAIITENSEDILEITFDDEHVWIIGIEEDLMYWFDVSQEGITEYIYEKQSSEVIDNLEPCPN